MLSSNIDDFSYLSDGEISGGAPGPGRTTITEVGGSPKPSATALGVGDWASMNRWCAMECERARTVEFKLLDFDNRVPNRVET